MARTWTHGHGHMDGLSGREVLPLTQAGPRTWARRLRCLGGLYTQGLGPCLRPPGPAPARQGPCLPSQGALSGPIPPWPSHSPAQAPYQALWPYQAPLRPLPGPASPAQTSQGAQPGHHPHSPLLSAHMARIPAGLSHQGPTRKNRPAGPLLRGPTSRPAGLAHDLGQGPLDNGSSPA